MSYYAIGYRRTRHHKVLDVIFPEIQTNEEMLNSLHKLLKAETGNPHTLTNDEYQSCRNLAFLSAPIELTSQSNGYATMDTIFFILDDLNSPINTTEDAYFRLQLLSHRHVKPHEVNLDGIFSQLLNLAWTSIGPVLPDELSTIQANALIDNQVINVTHVDKFPYMVNYHIPSGVRIADASRVRLGAYLGEGTTIMPAGFVNFNAGTLGNAMVEGRISAGVIVGNNSDVGGGASIMGTLSGGNDRVISIGEKCLLGANAGIGISLGNGCTVAAGVYVYAGKKVTLLNESNEAVDMDGNSVPSGQNIVKASELSGSDFRLFFEDSQTGELICKPNTKVIQLNQTLHIND